MKRERKKYLARFRQRQAIQAKFIFRVATLLVIFFLLAQVEQGKLFSFRAPKDFSLFYRIDLFLVENSYAQFGSPAPPSNIPEGVDSFLKSDSADEKLPVAPKEISPAAGTAKAPTSTPTAPTPSAPTSAAPTFSQVVRGATGAAMALKDTASAAFGSAQAALRPALNTLNASVNAALEKMGQAIRAGTTPGTGPGAEALRNNPPGGNGNPQGNGNPPARTPATRPPANSGGNNGGNNGNNNLLARPPAIRPPANTGPGANPAKPTPPNFNNTRPQVTPREGIRAPERAPVRVELPRIAAPERSPAREAIPRLPTPPTMERLRPAPNVLGLDRPPVRAQSLRPAELRAPLLNPNRQATFILSRPVSLFANSLNSRINSAAYNKPVFINAWNQRSNIINPALKPAIINARPYVKLAQLPNLKPGFTKTAALKPAFTQLPKLNPSFTQLPKIKPAFMQLPNLTAIKPLKPAFTQLPKLNSTFAFTKLPAIKPTFTQLPKIKPVFTQLPKLNSTFTFTKLPALKPAFAQLPKLTMPQKWFTLSKIETIKFIKPVALPRLAAPSFKPQALPTIALYQLANNQRQLKQAFNQPVLIPAATVYLPKLTPQFSPIKTEAVTVTAVAPVKVLAPAQGIWVAPPVEPSAKARLPLPSELAAEGSALENLQQMFQRNLLLSITGPQANFSLIDPEYGEILRLRTMYELKG